MHISVGEQFDLPKRQNLDRHISGLKNIQPSRHCAFRQTVWHGCVAYAAFAMLAHLVSVEKAQGFYDIQIDNTVLIAHLMQQV